MSRLIVKNLPKYYTEENLKEHFAKKFSGITDVKLMKDRKGESRRFAFLGFKDYNDALEAVNYYDNSFIHTSRINVQLAKSFADPTVPIPMREKIRESRLKFQEKEERFKRRQEEEKAQKNKKRKVGGLMEDIDKEIESDLKLKEFLEVTKSATQVTSWDDSVVKNNSKSENETVSVAVKNAGDDEEYEDFKGLTQNDESVGSSEKMVSLSNFGKPATAGSEANEDSDKEESLGENGAEDDDIEVDLKAEPKFDENVSDMDWLKSKKKYIKPVQSEETESNQKTTTQIQAVDQDRGPEPEVPITPQTLEEQYIEKIKETSRLFIRNILYTATEDDFRNLFRKFGKIEEVHIAVDTRTNKSKGFVYVQFKYSKDAVNAYKKMDKQIFQGRLLHILPGDVKKSHRLDEFDLKNMPLKKQKDLKRKLEANKASFSWNSLFLNENAVLEAIADKTGLDKRELFDPESSNTAVKQALAEAHVIGDVRKYFEGKGIDIASFSKKEKDDKVILVKNFPFNTTQSEIVELFQQYGEINRVLFPPTGMIAVVEYKNVVSGRTAFSKLAYRRFKKNILYLEKGPKDLFVEGADVVDQANTEENGETRVDSVGKDVKPNAAELIDESSAAAEELELPQAHNVTVSVFLKNLNFKTTNEQLEAIFKSSDGFMSVRVSQKPDTKNPGKYLSMGFGFVEFRSKEQALQFIKENDGKVIDDHKIQLKLSNRVGSSGASQQKNTPVKGKKSTKIIVKNLPFEATRKDVFELFNSFGHLKSVRVPKKFNKSARGFAFVEFNLVKEAEHAIESLKGVHLLGRRLNIEYAERDAENAEEEISKMEQKVKKQRALVDFANASKLNGKKRVELDDDEDDF